MLRSRSRRQIDGQPNPNPRRLCLLRQGDDSERAGAHLGACAQRQEAIAAADEQAGRNQTLYHLQVQDAWGGAYWLHLEMRGSATLEDLDFYLREIWLECCGHLSAFEIGPVRYTQLFDDSMALGSRSP